MVSAFGGSVLGRLSRPQGIIFHLGVEPNHNLATSEVPPGIPTRLRRGEERQKPVLSSSKSASPSSKSRATTAATSVDGHTDISASSAFAESALGRRPIRAN